LKYESRKPRSRYVQGAILGGLCCLLSLAANAQVMTARLIPGALLKASTIQPGTLAQDAPAQTPDTKLHPWDSGLHIEILKGDRGVNIIKKDTAVTPVVEVKDRNNLPVAGVLVLFTSPGEGPSVTFINGERSFSVITEANGQAAAPGLKPVNTGSFDLQVTATYKAEAAATATITMANYLTASQAAKAGHSVSGAGTAGLSHTTIAILVGVAAAAAIGIGVGLGGHGSSSSASTGSTTATIGAGTGGTVGVPH
jgi:hypothetical protein